jgi:peptide deformylase
MIYEIVQAGDRVLRTVAEPVDLSDCTEPWFKELVSDLRETMRDAPGVGLAAPQIGRSLRVFVIEDDSEYLEELDEKIREEAHRERVPFYVVVNPTLTPLGDETATYFEGCLSVSGFRGEVTRALSVRVDGWNENGEPISVEANGWHARILQHEFDHLNGILYIDRMDTRSFTTEDNLEAEVAEEQLIEE